MAYLIRCREGLSGKTGKEIHIHYKLMTFSVLGMSTFTISIFGFSTSI